MDDQDLFDKVAWITEKTRDKIKTIIKNNEKVKCVRISNHVQFQQKKYWLHYLHLLLVKSIPPLPLNLMSNFNN